MFNCTNNQLTGVFKILLLLLFLIIRSTVVAWGQAALKLHSPNGVLIATISLTPDRHLQYNFGAGNSALITNSLLGISLGGYQYGSRVNTMETAPLVKLNQKYKITGKHAFAINICNNYRITVNEHGKKWILAVKLFNDGLAFRYEFPGQNDWHVDGELSSFSLPAKSQVWFFERNNDWKLKSYAGEWMSAPLKSMLTVSQQGPIQGKPLIVVVPGGQYIAITEAGLYHYSGLRFKAIDTTTFQANFTEGVNGFNVTGSLITPWRAVIYALNLNQLVNSDMINNLNPLPDPQLFNNKTYIKPGRAVWSWMTKDTAYLHPWKEEQFIDNAAQLNFNYTLIDEGWEKQWPHKWQQLKKLCDYARQRHISIFVWKHSNELQTPEKRKDFLDSVKKTGAVGVKVDFMNSEFREVIDFDINLLKDAAEKQLLVVLHGCQAPSGESKTYPNELSREGIRGMELNGMKEGPITAAHNAALPFTRYIVGHGDYTPGFFSNPGNTTWGQQLACLYLFDSPFLCLAEDPAYILKHPNLKQIVPLLKTLPVTWDETIVLAGSKIGKLAAMARRKGRDWYITVINGENIARNFTIPASFLNKAHAVTGQLYNDRPGIAKNIAVKNISFTGKTTTINLEPNGGFIIALTPTNKKTIKN